MLQVLVYVILGLLFLPVILHTLVRFIRHLYKFPMPEVLANVIDNPLRRKGLSMTLARTSGMGNLWK